MHFLIQLASCPSNDLQPHPKAKLELWQLKPNQKPLKRIPDTSTDKLLVGIVSEKQWIIELEFAKDFTDLSKELGFPLIMIDIERMMELGYFDQFENQTSPKVDGGILVYDIDIENITN